MKNNKDKLTSTERNNLRSNILLEIDRKPYERTTPYFVDHITKRFLSILLLVAFPGVGLLSVAEGALPKDGFLYDIKRGAEEVTVLFQKTSDEKIIYRKNQIKKRVEEITELVLAGSISNKQANVLQQDIASHVVFAEKVAREELSQSLENSASLLVSDTLSSQQKVLKTVVAEYSYNNETEQALKNISNTTAILQAEIDENLSKSDQELDASSFFELLKTVKTALTVATLDLDKKQKYASDVGVQSFHKDPEDIFNIYDTMELSGAGNVLDNLEIRYLELEKKRDVFGVEDFKKLRSLKTDIDAFISLLESDITLADMFLPTDTNLVDDTSNHSDPVHVDSIENQKPQEKIKLNQINQGATKENF